MTVSDSGSRGVVRVVVDGYSMSNGSQLRGIGTFLREVLTGLAQKPDLEVRALVGPGAVLPDDVERGAMKRHAYRPTIANLEHELRLPRDLRRASGDVVWAPGTPPPRHCRAPFVQTVFDLTPLVFRDWTMKHERRRWERSIQRVRNAERVVTASNSAADQVMRLFGVDAARVEVVPCGVDPRFAPGAVEASDPPYLLYVGGWGPHKGYADAMAVVSALADDGFPHRLLMVGPQDAWTDARIKEQLDACGRPDRIDVRGWVDDIVGCYRGASALLFTSRAEGFGLPVLEALACGLPVVAFDNTSIPEVLGPAGLAVPDGDLRAFTAAVARLLREPTLRDELARAGIEQASRFRWNDTVDRYHDILRASAAKV